MYVRKYVIVMLLTSLSSLVASISTPNFKIPDFQMIGWFLGLPTLSECYFACLTYRVDAPPLGISKRWLHECILIPHLVQKQCSHQILHLPLFEGLSLTKRPQESNHTLLVIIDEYLPHDSKSMHTQYHLCCAYWSHHAGSSSWRPADPSIAVTYPVD
jgi:hypothetical protein